MYFMVVSTSECPIQAWTRTTVARLMAIEPNVWTRGGGSGERCGSREAGPGRCSNKMYGL